MPRTERVDMADEIYHVINRGNGRQQIFHEEDDYLLFESLLEEAKSTMVDMRIIAYVLMPNHWHLVLQPKKDGDLALFMHWITTTHTRKHHVKTKTIGGGHLYQGRYKSFLVGTDGYLFSVIKYVERNPVRAKITSLCEEWRWGSAWRRISGDEKQKKFLSPPPGSFPPHYRVWINTDDNVADLEEIRNSVNKGAPYGGEKWAEEMIEKYSLSSTLRKPGRPKKKY